MYCKTENPTALTDVKRILAQGAKVTENETPQE